MTLAVAPTTLREANEFVANFHRHSKPTQGGRFAIAAVFDQNIVGVAIVGRPVSQTLQDGLTAEITRLCVSKDAPKNTCSFLYGRCWRIWQQMGGNRMITYTLQSESGASLKGAGWTVMGQVKPHDRWTKKGGNREWQPVYGQLKFRWEKHI
jgi:hypothetical protein|tara:strand:+ start:68 stop:523 length:456 start_codon:yes stop_codon:yes gene_type:complete